MDSTHIIYIYSLIYISNIKPKYKKKTTKQFDMIKLQISQNTGPKPKLNISLPQKIKIHKSCRPTSGNYPKINLGTHNLS